MAADLGLGVEIVGVPTVRDADGLALSSRNAYLAAEDRQRAVALPTALENARASDPVRRAGRRDAGQRKAALEEAGFASIDYFALVDAASLEPLDAPRGAMRLIAAATIGGTRLIDNIAVETDTSPQR